MKTIQPSPNKHRWPRCPVDRVECRKRDLVIRIADWMGDEDEPAYDVEIYVGGVYDWGLSQDCKTKAQAIAFAQKRIGELL